jgi:hypothetical protein
LVEEGPVGLGGVVGDADFDWSVGVDSSWGDRDATFMVFVAREPGLEAVDCFGAFF